MTTSSEPQPLTSADLNDIQGVIVRGYNMASMRHFVLTVGDVDAAKHMLDELTGGGGAPLSVTSAAQWPAGSKPDYALNVGFSAAGLEALRLPASVSFGSRQDGNFAPFLQGVTNRATKIGDVGASAPDTWVPKLTPAQAPDAHMLISLYAQSPELREQYSATLRGMFKPVLPTSGPAAEVLEWDVDAMVITLPDGRVQHKIHFGYTDGISNPVIAVEGQPPLRPNELPNVMPWRFVMREDALAYYPPAPAEFGLNGSFTAFRILEQDVQAFDAFLAKQGDADKHEHLAAKLCGRWRNGNPVVQAPDAPGEVLSYADLRDFDYGTDQVGEPCPYSSHTRRANPRGGPGVAGVTESTKTSFRIMRRANAYGPKWTGTPDGKGRGLAGHFICASLDSQFEFIMAAWVNKGEFAAKPAGVDPLLAHVPADSTFTYYENAKPVTVPGLDQFVTTRGSLYCFLPSLSSLRWMATHAGAPTNESFTVQ